MLGFRKVPTGAQGFQEGSVSDSTGAFEALYYGYTSMTSLRLPYEFCKSKNRRVEV